MKLASTIGSFIATITVLVFASSAWGQTIWFHPSIVRPDYQALFDPNAPWQSALSHTKVFQVDRSYIWSRDDATVTRTLNFLKEKRVKLAVVFGVVPGYNPDRTCGLEGTAHTPTEQLKIVQKLKRLGGELDYIVANESLWWGHLAEAEGGCRYSISELAAGYAREIRQVRSVYPNALLIETETSSGISPAILAQSINSVRAQLGDGAPKAISFDVQWYRPWQQTMPPLLSILKEKGISYGVIFKGTYQNKTDEDYIVAAKRHIHEWQSAINEQPEFVLFQSWEKHPKRVLPETSPETMTYMIKWYCDQRQDQCQQQD